MEVNFISKFEITEGGHYLVSDLRLFKDHKPRLVCSITNEIIERTGYIVIGRRDMNVKLWFVNGVKATAQEVFESLSNEDKEKALWELNEWL